MVEVYGPDGRTYMYVSSANSLEQRVYNLIPAHPEILEFEDAWALFDVPEFRCDDLQPSLAQADWALSHAVQRYRQEYGSEAEVSASVSSSV